MQERIGNIELDYTYYPGEDIYSDGPIEDELLEIAKSCTESELNAEIARRKSWPVLYHFSHIRQNILEWVPFRKTDRVLEIGSGCGCHRTEGWIRYLYRSFQKEKLYQCLQKPCI